MNTIIKIDTMFYNFIFYTSVKNPKSISKQLSDPKKMKIFSDYWKKYCSIQEDIVNSNDLVIEIVNPLNSSSSTGSGFSSSLRIEKI
jgi:hypothetical protein